MNITHLLKKRPETVPHGSVKIPYRYMILFGIRVEYASEGGHPAIKIHYSDPTLITKYLSLHHHPSKKELFLDKLNELAAIEKSGEKISKRELDRILFELIALKERPIGYITMNEFKKIENEPDVLISASYGLWKKYGMLPYYNTSIPAVYVPDDIITDEVLRIVSKPSRKSIVPVFPVEGIEELTLGLAFVDSFTHPSEIEFLNSSKIYEELCEKVCREKCAGQEFAPIAL